MTLGLMACYSGATINLPVELVRESDRLGYYSVWTSKAYGSDAITPLAWRGALTEKFHLGTAIMRMSARTLCLAATNGRIAALALL